jgi:hypothetical protein
MRHYLTFFSILLSLVSTSQSLLPAPRNIQATYKKGTRSADGRPGPAYWQNTANYDMKIRFDPYTRWVMGIADIDYTNNSPDTLRQIWFKLYQNLYKAGSPRDSKIDQADAGEGVIIDSVWVNGKGIDMSRFSVNGTNATLGRQSILHGQTIRIRISWHFTLNKGSHNRTGQVEPNAAFIAYFFPRIAVYDDIDGWNTIPYTGRQEFYNDFCNFKVAITVPRTFGVWATGDCVNERELFAEPYSSRLAEAYRSNNIITIIDSNEANRKKDILSGTIERSWIFEAKNVTDFAFATSDHYVWQSSSIEVDPKTKRRVRVDAVFNPKHTDYWLVASDARKTVEAMSYVFPAWPFPYSHITVFDGLDQMEYPMMVNDNPVEDRHESIELTDHEVFHTMFPFYMGTNETKYAWMDEGWATIGEWLISPIIDSTIVDTYGVGPYANLAGTENDLPVMTPSTELNRGYFINSYPKPALGYLYVKDYLGDSLFKKALHHYITQWQGKHPMPNDFFYCMNAGSGKNLNWFWKKWFFEPGIPDLAISSVKSTGNKHTITIGNKGGKPLPVDILVTYTDGSTERIHRSIDIWEKGNTVTMLIFTAKKTMSKLLLADPHTPDSNRADNAYEIK